MDKFLSFTDNGISVSLVVDGEKCDCLPSVCNKVNSKVQKLQADLDKAVGLLLSIEDRLYENLNYDEAMGISEIAKELNKEGDKENE